MTRRIIHNRRLTAQEAAKYDAVREQVAKELPDLIARHHERMATLDQLRGLLAQLKAAREAKGLSLADLTEVAGMDRSALSKLETGQRPNPAVETLVRDADAVGKRLVLSLFRGWRLLRLAGGMRRARGESARIAPGVLANPTKGRIA